MDSYFWVNGYECCILFKHIRCYKHLCLNVSPLTNVVSLYMFINFQTYGLNLILIFVSPNFIWSSLTRSVIKRFYHLFYHGSLLLETSQLSFRFLRTLDGAEIKQKGLLKAQTRIDWLQSLKQF